MMKPDKPGCILTLGSYPDYGFSVRIHLTSSKALLPFQKFRCPQQSHTTKVLKVATLSRTDKQEKSEQEMIMFGFCKTIILLSSVTT
jgi:hypothetical protein